MRSGQVATCLNSREKGAIVGKVCWQIYMHCQPVGQHILHPGLAALDSDRTAGDQGLATATAGAGVAVSDEQPLGHAPGGRGRGPEPVLADHLVLGLRARRPSGGLRPRHQGGGLRQAGGRHHLHQLLRPPATSPAPRAATTPASRGSSVPLYPPQPPSPQPASVCAPALSRVHWQIISKRVFY